MPEGPVVRSLLPLLTIERGDPLGFLARSARETSAALIELRLGATRVFLVTDPQLVQEILLRRSRSFRKAAIMQTAGLAWGRTLLGEGLLVSEGEAWAHQRQLMHAFFRRDRVDHYAVTMVERARAMLASWTDGISRDVWADTTKLSVDIVLRTLFDTASEHRAGELAASLRVVFARRRGIVGLLLPEWLPTPGNIAMRRAVRRLDEAVETISGGPDGDPSSLLFALRQGARSGEPGSQRMVRDQIITMLVAAYDPVALTVSRCWDLLADRPDLNAKLAAEVDSVIGSRPPRLDDIPHLPYLSASVNETLRLYPPGRSVVRQALEDCAIDGHVIPAGAMVVMSQWVLQRDPRFFDEPDSFLPERWLGKAVEALPPFAFFPFGAGPRQCIGQEFGLAAVQMTLAVVAQQFVLQRTGRDDPNERWDRATLRPRDGSFLVPHRRHPPAAA